MKRWVVYGVAICILAAFGGGAFYQWAEENYQQCADATRMSDLFTIAQMIEDYHELEGRYPFQPEDDTVTEALLASRALTDVERRGPADEPMLILDKDAFYDELDRVLGAERVMRLVDPQKVAMGAPNFYQYRVDREAYYVSVHLNKPVPQSQELGPNYHKVQLSSVYDPNNKIYPFLQVPVDSILAASQVVAQRCG